MNENEENDFDIKQALYTIRSYSWSIILITILFMVVSGVLVYFKPPMYSSTALLQIQSDRSKKSSDTMMQAFGYEQADLNNEKRILSSRYLIAKALKNLELGTRYYVKKDMRLTELYKKSPFVVNVSFIDYHLLGKKIQIKPINEKEFELTYQSKIEWSLKTLKNFVFSTNKPKIDYHGIHKFGEDTSTPFFKINVTKVHEFLAEEYFFSYVKNEHMDMYIQNNLSVAPASKYGSNFLIIMNDTVPFRAKDIVDAMVNTYIKDEIERKRASAEKSLEFIDKQLEGISQTLNKSEVVLQKYKQTNTLIDLRSAVAVTGSQLSKLKADLNKLSSEENILENLQDFIETNEDLSGLTLQSSDIMSETLNTMIADYKAAQIKQRSMLVELTEIHPDVLKLNETIYNLRRNIEETIIQSLRAIKQKKDFLSKSIEKTKASFQKLPEQERELGVLTRSSAVNERIYSFLLQRRAETAILHSSTLSKTRVIDNAIVPLMPYGPNKMRYILMGALLGLVFGILMAFVRAYMNNTISNIREVEKLTSLPVYGRIPENKKGIPSMMYEEAFRVLRTNLEFVKSENTSKNILVTSAISGEGKSTTAKNLALMLAKLDRKVVVLDLDLRQPSLHKYFENINNMVGLSTLLSGQTTITESLVKMEDGIDLITAGPIPPNPSELIMSDAMDLLLKTLGKHYDYILIDSPPYAIVTDAAILMKEADITLFSVMANHSTRDIVKEINKIAQQYETKSAGIVYHGVKLNKKERSGYGYYT